MSETQTIRVPDIGDFKDVEIIEVLVKDGDQVNPEDALITIESDKASMDIPSPAAGTVQSVKVSAGDKINQGDVILLLQAADETAVAKADKTAESKATKEPAAPEKQEPPAKKSAAEAAKPSQPSPESAPESTPEPATDSVQPPPPPATPGGAETVGSSQSHKAHASPSVRRFARELGVDLGLVRGSGRKGRITKDDVKAFTKAVMSGNRVFGNTGGFALPEIPAVDFSKYGPVEDQPLTRLRKLAGQHLQRCWLTVPQVTQFDEADITNLEEFRKSKMSTAEKAGAKLTLVSFLLKAVVVALEQYPEFNSSLSSDGESLIMKKYFHIGVAVNTDEGLMVPIIRDVDQKGLYELAQEIKDLSERARNKQIKSSELQGGCFTISSLGGVGGRFFTPIVNTPEVAILGVSKAYMQPVWQDGSFVPRLTLPFALSYDHRVIDGMAGVQFTQYLRTVLTDIRHILL